MLAAWYEKKGKANEVYNIGQLETPEPKPDEVRVRLYASGVNHTDCKRRSGHGSEDWNYTHHFPDFPIIIPNNDGAGMIDKVGDDVSNFSIGDRVWIFNARYRRAFGTAAEYIVIPANLAAHLPDSTSYIEGACLGVPAMTAHRCLFSDGDIEGTNVLVTGGAGCVGNYAVQLAKLYNANVITTVSSSKKAEKVHMADHIINYREMETVSEIMRITDGEGVDRIVDVNLGVHWEINYKILKENGTISSYASMGNRNPIFPHYELMLGNANIRLVMIHCSPFEALQKAAKEITGALQTNDLVHNVAELFPLEKIHESNEAVESGEMVGNVILEIGDD